MITPAEFEDRMNELEKNDDVLKAIMKANKLMCDVLEDLGYTAGVRTFKQMERWYS